MFSVCLAEAEPECSTVQDNWDKGEGTSYRGPVCSTARWGLPAVYEFWRVLFLGSKLHFCILASDAQTSRIDRADMRALIPSLKAYQEEPSSSHLCFLLHLYYKFTSTLNTPWYSGLELWLPSMWYLILPSGRMKPFLCKLQSGIWKNVADCSLYWEQSIQCVLCFLLSEFKILKQETKTRNKLFSVSRKIQV